MTDDQFQRIKKTRPQLFKEGVAVISKEVQIDDYIETFAFGIAHQLNHPLRSSIYLPTLEKLLKPKDEIVTSTDNSLSPPKIVERLIDGICGVKKFWNSISHVSGALAIAMKYQRGYAVEQFAKVYKTHYNRTGGYSDPDAKPPTFKLDEVVSPGVDVDNVLNLGLEFALQHDSAVLFAYIRELKLEAKMSTKVLDLLSEKLKQPNFVPTDIIGAQVIVEPSAEVTSLNALDDDHYD